MFFLSSRAQNDLSHMTVFRSNGKVVEGLLLTKIFGKPEFRLEIDGKSKRIQTRKVDSLYIDDTKYLVEKDFGSPALLEVLDTGMINLYEVNDKSLAIRRGEKDLIHIRPKKYHEAPYYLGYKGGESSEKLSKEELISIIKEINDFADSSTVKLVPPIDSVSVSVRNVSGRFSFLRPELGVEVKLSNSFSIFNSFGLNFGGDSFRDAQTFVNYDYSSELRWFYSRKRRLRKDKNVYNFSGPFIAATYKYLIDVNRDNQGIIGLLHGWQTNVILFSNSYFGYRLGLGYSPINEEVYFLGMLNTGFHF
jgi:hypothetical protein